jgi:hypothetical protein
MALPKIATPTYELTVPSNKDTLKYRPFLVKEEKILLLANEADDADEMMSAVKQIINNCTFEGIDVDGLALFDLEYLFLKIRSKSVGEIVKLKLPCDDDEETLVDVTVNLDDVEVDFNKEHTNQIQLTDEICLIMNYPQYEFLNTPTTGSETAFVFKLIKRCISSIVEGDTVIERADFTDKELDEFLESLTTQHFQKLQEFFETMPRIRHEVKFKNPNTKKQTKITLEGMQSFFE